MKKNKQNKPLSIRDRMVAAEMQGAKIATIINKAREKANKLLAKSGHGVNIQVDFYRLEDESTPNQEVKDV